MRQKQYSYFSLLIVLTVLLMSPLVVQSNPTDLAEVAHMKAGHQKVEGIVSEVKSGLYTVKTSTGATLTLTEATSIREGHPAPKVGDELILWVNEGNMVMDARPKGHTGKTPHFITGTLVSIDNGAAQMRLATSKGERTYHLKPESRMFREIAVGTEVTIEVNDRGEVIDIHRDRKLSR